MVHITGQRMEAAMLITQEDPVKKDSCSCQGQNVAASLIYHIIIMELALAMN
jgi:hypothetical protein